MATVNISVTRDNGTTISGAGIVDDALLAEVAAKLAGLIVAGVNGNAPANTNGVTTPRPTP